MQHALEALVKGRTVVMIAHKLKTVAGADQILVLDQGKIVERGTHTELLQKDSLYAHLWNVQKETSGWQIHRKADSARLEVAYQQG